MRVSREGNWDEWLHGHVHDGNFGGTWRHDYIRDEHLGGHVHDGSDRRRDRRWRGAPAMRRLVNFVPPGGDGAGVNTSSCGTPADKQSLAVERSVGDLGLVPGLVDASGLESLRVITGDVLASDDNEAAPATATLFVGLDAFELIGGHFGVGQRRSHELHGVREPRTISGLSAAEGDLR